MWQWHQYSDLPWNYMEPVYFRKSCVGVIAGEVVFYEVPLARQKVTLSVPPFVHAGECI